MVLDFLLASGTAEVSGTGNHRRESRWNTLVLLQYSCSRNGRPHYKSKSCVCLFFSAGLCRKVRCTLCYKQYLNSVDWHRHYWDTKLFVTGQNLKNSPSTLWRQFCSGMLCNWRGNQTPVRLFLLILFNELNFASFSWRRIKTMSPQYKLSNYWDSKALSLKSAEEKYVFEKTYNGKTIPKVTKTHLCLEL